MELKKYEESRQRALDQRDAQNKQLDELKERILAERAGEKKEGLLLKQRAEMVGLCDACFLRLMVQQFEKGMSPCFCEQLG